MATECSTYQIVNNWDKMVLLALGILVNVTIFRLATGTGWLEYNLEDKLQKSYIWPIHIQVSKCATF